MAAEHEIICRKELDEKYHNEWLCECPKCKMEKEEIQLKTKTEKGEKK